MVGDWRCEGLALGEPQAPDQSDRVERGGKSRSKDL